MSDVETRIRSLVREIPDFPSDGIVFKDITPLLADPRGLRDTIDALVAPWRREKVDVVVGMEARGFALGPPVAMALGASGYDVWWDQELRGGAVFSDVIQRELRSQYLVTYQSSNTADDDEFRRVELDVDRPDVTVKTLSGYYP